MPNLYSLSTTLVFAILQLTGFSSPAQAEPNESEEPSLSINLMVDGKQFPVQIGQETDMPTEGKSVRIVITKSDERKLHLQHLRFRYPDYFKFEVSFKGDSQEPVRWDLEGQDVDVTVFRASSDKLRYLEGEHPLGAWVRKLFGEETITGEVKILELGQMKIQGARYSVPINMGSIDTKISFDVFEVPGNFGAVRYFLLLSGWDGDNPKEERLVRDLLRKSFKVGEEFAKNE